MYTSLAEMWLYSASAWCSDTHTYFQPVRSATSTRSASLSNAACSAAVSWAFGPGTNPWMKMPNSTVSPSLWPVWSARTREAETALGDDRTLDLAGAGVDRHHLRVAEGML